MEEEQSPLTAIISVVGVILVIIISALAIASIINTPSFDCENITVSSNETVLTSSSQTLSQSPTSLTAQAYNETWVDCDGIDNYFFTTVTESKSTVSLWFKNSTTDWTSYIKSANDVYIDGSIEASWTFSPFYLASDNILFCMDGIGSYLNMSIDAVRVYEQILNSTEVMEVYNYGR